LIAFTSKAQKTIYNRTKEIVGEFSDAHVQPLKMDSTFNERLGTLLLNEMDDRGYFFLKFDSITIMQTKYADNEGITKTLDFKLRGIHKNYLERIKYVRNTFNNMKDQGAKYTEFGRIYFDGSPSTYKKDYPELLRKWKSYLTYITYLKIFETVDPKIMVNKDSTHAIFPKFWNQTIDEEYCSLNDYDLSYEEFCNVFLECVTKSYDPHSSFFTYEESMDFFNSISTENLSFGFYMGRNKNNSLEITYLIPGGAAWNSGELNEGDLILQLISGESDTVDVKCIDPYDLIEDLNNGKNKQLKVKIKKQNGEIKTVNLIKTKVEIEENNIKSYLINDDIGYINLPGFYSSWDQYGGTGCSEDMAKEVMKLNRDNMKGLIVDLRFNGGGSLQEAIDLCGIFINEGPLCITYNKEEGAKSMKDKNRGTIYDGPMIILVNPYSASASELFAGIMQDYNRAVVVGDTTYGKGSVQRTYDSHDGNYGFKVTTEGFYSIDLKSHQQIGIIPDILLPDYYFNKPREKDELFPLTFPEVEKTLYLTLLDPLPLEQLRKNSKTRIEQSDYFNNRLKIQDLIDEFDNKSFDLNYEGVMAIYEYYTSFDKYQTDLKTEEENTIKNNSTDALLIDFDETKKETNKYAMDDLKKDIYLREGMNILYDLIQLKK
jgi:carboxyl-terminal processing protease